LENLFSADNRVKIKILFYNAIKLLFAKRDCNVLKMYIYVITVLRVVDGDTIDADIDLGFNIWVRKARIRLAGIDCPESRSRDKVEKKHGLMAKECLSELLESKKITLESHGKGKFGRVLGVLFSDGEDVNKKMIKQHHAVAYSGQSKDDIMAAHLANRQKLKAEMLQ